jgi:hypothetical protein
MALLDNTSPREADSPHVTQKKVLQKLNTGLGPSGTQNVAITGGAAPNQVSVTNGGNPGYLDIDAFGRLRVSEPVTLFDSKLDINARGDQWDETIPMAHDPDEARVIIPVPATSVATRARQTFRRFAYQPGKSQQILMTFSCEAAAAGITRRVGAFDADNGLFLEVDLAGIRFVVRSSTTGSPVDTPIEQADWNVDKMDGTGVSGVTLDMNQSQILFIQYEWLGVGSVGYGFFIDGAPVIAHVQHHANRENGVYMSTPNLPLRYEIANDGTGPAANLFQICSAVNAEGGQQVTGHLRSADRGSTSLVTLNDADLYPLIAIRLKTGNAERASVLLDSFSAVCTSTAIWRWALLLNPSVAGTALSFSTSAGLVVEADVAATNATKVSGGTVIASGHASGTATVDPIASQSLANDVFLGADISGTRDVLVLAVQRLTGTTETFYGAIGFREQV